MMSNLTIYLLREEYTTPQSAIDGIANEFQITNGDEELGTLYVKDMPAKPPRWVDLFSPYTLDLSALVRSAAALYITAAGGRLFAIAFGHGRHLLKPGAYEDRFGLLVVINALKNDQLRSIDKRTFDTVDQNVRSQVSQQSSATEFGIDIERDLIRGITGIPTDSTLGLRMTGADSLVVSVECEVPDLQALLQRYLEAFDSDAYKDGFRWIDQIRQVADKTPLKARLDATLAQKMNEAKDNAGHAPGLWLAIPDIIDYTGVHRFRFTGGKGSHNDLHMPGFIETLNDDDFITVELLRQKYVFAVDDDGRPVGDKWPIYKCIHFEVEEGESTYLLAAGKWFRVRTEFSVEVNEFYDAVPIKDLGWIKYKHESEGKYNEAIYDGGNGRYALMDAVNIPVGGVRDKIEFCDLYSKDRELIHVKRYGSSSLLGHLFNQGLVSGEHLKMDEAFQEEVNKKIQATHALQLEDKVPRKVSDFTIIFAIISEYQGDDLHIPFFAKVAFKHAYTRLKSLGYDKILRAKITVDEVYSKTLKPKNAAKKAARKTAVKTAQKVVALVKATPLSMDSKKTVFKTAK